MKYQYKCGCGKKEAHKNRSMIICKGSTRYWNHLEDFRNCTGEHSAVNAHGTQLRDLISSGLTRWRFTVYSMYDVNAVEESGRDPVSKHRIQPGCEK